jgi:general secretion pathway protein J
MSLFTSKDLRCGKGFTLLEILVAVAILSIVLTAIYSTFILSQKAIDGVDESMLKLQESRRAIDIMRCELDSAVYDKKDDATLLQMKDRDICGKQASQLSFTAFSALRPGLAKISYYVEQKDNKLNLMKKIDSPYSDKETEGVDIIDDLQAFTVEAKYDDKWVKTWDAAVNGKIPDEVKIVLIIPIKGKDVTLSDISKSKIGKSL